MLLAAALLASCGGTGGAGSARVILGSGGDEVALRVEVADSPEERSKGLMGRPSLPEDTGMVFLHREPTTGSFWMKDTLIPLSVAFWGPEGRILAILDMEPCRAEPCELYSPGVTWTAALEVDQGFFAEHGVAVGDEVRLHL